MGAKLIRPFLVLCLPAGLLAAPGPSTLGGAAANVGPATASPAVVAPVPPYPIYRPAPATADLAQRQASWRALRVRQVDDAGLAAVGTGTLDMGDQGRYYRSADARLAVRELHDSRAARIQGVIWYAAAPAVGLVAGAYIGGGIGSTQGTAGSYENNTAIGEGMLWGLGIGAVLGTTLGVSMGYHKMAESLRLKRDAAETFNRKLLRDLDLSLAPIRGGEELRLQKRF